MNKHLPKIIGGFINTIALFYPKYAGKLALQLFSIPRKGKLKTHESHFLNKAKQKDISYKDFKIKTYQWQGSGDTILLAHGWESNSYRWKNFIEILIEKQYNVIALDAPAHGGSGNKEFNAVLYSECINLAAKAYKPNIIIGHSVGGMALVFAMHNHNFHNLSKIVLLGAPDAFSNILDSYECVMGYNTRTKRAIRAFIFKKFNFLPEHFSTSKFTANLTIDALIIHDLKDKIIPFKDGIRIKNNFPRAKFIETKSYGHGLKSNEVYNHILSFLNA